MWWIMKYKSAYALPKNAEIGYVLISKRVFYNDVRPTGNRNIRPYTK